MSALRDSRAALFRSPLRRIRFLSKTVRYFVVCVNWITPEFSLANTGPHTNNTVEATAQKKQRGFSSPSNAPSRGRPTKKQPRAPDDPCPLARFPHSRQAIGPTVSCNLELLITTTAEDGRRGDYVYTTINIASLPLAKGSRRETRCGPIVGTIRPRLESATGLSRSLVL